MCLHTYFCLYNRNLLGLALMTTLSPECKGGNRESPISSLEPNSTTSTKLKGTLHLSRKRCPEGTPSPPAPTFTPSWEGLKERKASLIRQRRDICGGRSFTIKKWKCFLEWCCAKLFKLKVITDNRCVSYRQLGVAHMSTSFRRKTRRSFVLMISPWSL